MTEIEIKGLRDRLERAERLLRLAWNHVPDPHPLDPDPDGGRELCAAIMEFFGGPPKCWEVPESETGARRLSRELAGGVARGEGAPVKP